MKNHRERGQSSTSALKGQSSMTFERVAVQIKERMIGSKYHKSSRSQD